MNVEQAKALPYPTQVMIQTTSRCNSACVICPYPKLASKIGQSSMSDETFNALITEIAGYPKIERLMLYLMNEPLCDPNILRRIETARTALPETEIYLLTNGVNLTDKIADGLIASGLSWIGFSVHAIENDTYEKITGRKDFDKIKARITGFIEKAKAARGENFVQVNITRVRPFVSEDEFAAAAKYWRGRGLSRVDLDNGYISRAGNVEVFGHEPVSKKRIVGCDTLWAYKMAHVLADGAVIACCMDWGREAVFGNVNKRSLLDIWRGDERKSFLDRIGAGGDLPEDFLCCRCEDAIPAPVEEKSAEVHESKNGPADILLVNPPPWLPDGPPLGIASLTAYLRDRGFAVDVIDANIELYTESPEATRTLWDWEQGFLWEKPREVDRLFGEALDRIAQRIADHPARTVGFSVASRKEYPLARIVKKLSGLAPEKKLILGGPGVSQREDRDRIHNLIGPAVSGTGADILYAFVVGEGEAALSEFLETLRAGKSLEGIDGVAVYRSGGQAFYQKRKELADLSDLPIPDFNGLPLTKYTHPSLTVEWSRGCIGDCGFCNIRGLWGRYRSKSATQVVAEMEHLFRQHGKTWFSICDPVINGRPKVLDVICDGIIEKKLDIRWSAALSPNREMEPELFAKMKAAGCYRLEFGLESASDTVLTRMGKYYNAEAAGKMLDACAASGIEVVLYLIVGFPGETEEDVAATCQFLTKHAASLTLVRSVNGLILVPGTPIERRPGDYGILEPDRANPGWVTRWQAEDQTVDDRLARIDKVLATLNELGVPVEFSNREELLEDKALFAKRTEKIEKRLDDFESRMRRFIDLQDKVLRGEPIRENPFAGQLTLVLCPVWGVEMPPLGIGYLSAFLFNQGWKPELIDFNIDLYNSSGENLRTLFAEENFRHWTDPESFDRIRAAFHAQIDALVARLIESGKKIIGFSVYSPNRLFTIEVCRRIKRRAPETVIVIGGRGVLTENERLLFPPKTVDYFVVGDGEVTMVPLLEAIFSGRDGANLPGVVRFEGHHLTPLNPRPVYENLSIFPHPTFEGLDLASYRGEEIPLLFSRGCTGHCLFCNDHKAMGRFRIRPAAHMAAEVLWHVRTGNRRKFKFNDQHINGDLEQLEAFCDAIIEEGEPIEWIALAQPRGDMPDRLLHKMKAAGCYTLNLGVESGSPSVLKRMGKGFSVEDIARSLQQIFAAGINTMVNFIVGFPGETEEDFQATLEFIRQNRANICGVTSVNTCIVLEESPLHKSADKFGIQFPEINKDVDWIAGDNTPELRNERAKRLVALLDELGLFHLVSNLREKVADLDGLALPPAGSLPLDENPQAPVNKPDAPFLPAEEPCATCEDDGFDPSKGEPYFEQIDNDYADVLLILLPVWGTDVAPLSLGYLAAAVDGAGYKSTVLDLNIKFHNRAKDRKLWTMESYKYWTDPQFLPATLESFADLVDHYVAQIANHPAPVLGFSMVTANFPFTIHFAEKLRQAAPDKKIIFGGPGVTNSFDIANVTDKHADYLVLGEGESALVEIIRAIKKKKTPKVQGMIAVGDPIDFNALPKAMVSDIDDLPSPTFEQFDLSDYMSDAVPILTSRGCIRRCTFCNDHHIYQKYRSRDPERVFKEILYHVKTRGTDRFSLLDVLINGRPQNLERLCDMIIDSGLQIRWGGQGVIRKEMTRQLLDKMKAAGCMSMVYGVESFSDEILKLMNKPYTRELAKQVLQNTHDAGLETIINIIVGFPGEGQKEFNETYRFLRDNQNIIDQVASISPCLINLGSRLFEKYEEYGIRFPKEEGSIKWYTEDGNNFDVRRRRVLELTTLLSHRDKSVHTVNLYDEKRGALEMIEHDDADDDSEADSPQQKNAGVDRRPDALLLLLPPWGIDFPPISLATLATYARAKGFAVDLEDANIQWYDACGDYLKQWWEPERLKYWMPGDRLNKISNFLAPQIQSLIDKIKTNTPRMVGFSTNESNLIFSQNVALQIKQALPNLPIIFGGPGVSWPLDRARIDTAALDGFVVGEGEATFVEILTRLRKGIALDNLNGYLPVKKADEDAPLRELIKPLEEIPAPEFAEFPLHLYRRKELPLLFSRGCIGRCSFCNDHRLTPKFRIKKPETLFAEVKKYKDELAAFEFAFNDLLVNADLEALADFCDRIIAADLRMAWTGQAVIDARMDDAYMEKLRRAGCSSLVFGAESFSTPVLIKMRKRFVPKEAAKVFAAAKKAGIEVIVNIIVGFPGEGEKEFQQTLDFLRDNRKNIDRVSALSTCIVVAQSALEKDPDKYDIVLPKPEHWCQWHSKDGANTYEIRTQRMEQTLALLNELKIAHNMTNRYMEILNEEC